MLRGTNRSIIEVNNTENRYFEKIIIFVKPEFANLSSEKLEKEALRLIKNMSYSPFGVKGIKGARRRAAIRKRRLILFTAAVIFAAVAAAVIFL